jgi:guanylate kinase
MSDNKKGLALVISGPSGAGKSTVCNLLLEKGGNLHFSVSCTTRSPREGELNGVHYHFLSKGEFEDNIEAGNLLEYAEVHGNYYGTLKSEVLDQVNQGKNVLIDIDVQGQRLLRKQCEDDSALDAATVFIFFAPPSYAELEARLRGRGTETEEAIVKRLTNARGELDAWREYDFMIVNKDAQVAADELSTIIAASGLRPKSIQLDQGWPYGK